MFSFSLCAANPIPLEPLGIKDDSKRNKNFVKEMMKEEKWTLVRSLEKTYNKIAESLQNFRTDKIVTNRDLYFNIDKDEDFPKQVFVSFSKFYATFHNYDKNCRDKTDWKETYYQLESLEDGLEKHKYRPETELIIKKLASDLSDNSRIRSWDNAFQEDVQDMLLVCPEESSYRKIIESLTLVHDRDSFHQIKTELLQDPIKTIFVLIALESRFSCVDPKYIKDHLSLSCLLKRFPPEENVWETAGVNIEDFHYLCRGNKFWDLVDIGMLSVLRF